MKKSTRWILEKRPQKNQVNPWKPYAYFVEKERASDGRIKKVAALFLTNKECPFHCLMCDLWKNTTDERVPVGAIPIQIQEALQKLPKAEQIKLYNNGSFFDPQAIPPADFSEIATLLESFQTIIVECHPRFIDQNCLKFRDMLKADLQVAVGLETAHPEVLKKLNKQMTLTDFKRSVEFLHKYNISVRVFVLLTPPFLNEPESVLWAKKSIDFAFHVGAECCVIIPTRTGNGVMEQLQKDGQFSQPRIESLEEVLEYGIQKSCGRVFADLWDINKFSTCRHCLLQRTKRMQTMNFDQAVPPSIHCGCYEQRNKS